MAVMVYDALHMLNPLNESCESQLNQIKQSFQIHCGGVQRQKNSVIVQILMFLIVFLFCPLIHSETENRQTDIINNTYACKIWKINL